MWQLPEMIHEHVIIDFKKEHELGSSRGGTISSSEETSNKMLGEDTRCTRNVGRCFKGHHI